MIVIVGSPDEIHCRYIKEMLTERGVECLIIDAKSFPESQQICIKGNEISLPCELKNTKSVYVRNIYSSPIIFGEQIDKEMAENWYATLNAFAEKGTFLKAMLLILENNGAKVINPARADITTIKPFQLSLMKKNGIPIPDTIITNSSDEVIEFAKKYEKIIYKPLTAGATVRLLEKKDLTEERLSLLRNSPVMFQEFIPGENMRVYVVEDEIASCGIIHTEDEIDFRRGEKEIEQIKLDSKIEEMCIKAAQVCGLLFTAIDFKKNSTKTTLLELNHSPMFYGYDLRINPPHQVGKKLVESLIG